MSTIQIKKGHDLDLAGKPEKVFGKTADPKILLVSPLDYPGLKPKILVKEGDIVKTGTPLFIDKSNPDLIFCSPGSGKIFNIQIGERRRVEGISIQLGSAEEQVELRKFDAAETQDLSAESIRNHLLQTGLWPFIRQRPFSKIANPSDSPKAIFISAAPSAPFAPDYDFIFNAESSGFQEGLNILAKLTNGDVHLTIPENSSFPGFTQSEKIKIHHFKGPHPAGNVGVQIHHIDPIRSAADIVWYVNPQDVRAIGQLFYHGEYPKYKYITVGGNGVASRHYVKYRRGTRISDILKNNKVQDDVRLISGDVLSGTIITMENSLGCYDDILSVIPEGKKRRFLGWLTPGFKFYSLSRSFPSGFFGQKDYPADTLVNGSKRAIIPFGQIESVLPMDIMPTFLIKAILSRDFEEMEKLGIYECSPEDFALCSYADVSKMEISEIIQDGLDFMETEG